jgi:two-component system, LytTR family, sensor kinase
MAIFSRTISYPMKSGFRTWGLVIFISGLLFIFLYAYLYFSETGRFPELTSATDGAIISILIGVITGSCLYLFNRTLDRWISWRNNFAIRFLTGYVANTTIALLISLGTASLFIRLFSTDIFWTGLSLKDDDLFAKIIILFLCSIFLYNIIYSLLYSYQQYEVAQIESLQSERKQLELQFEALKSQVSPHYLFNSLNTISSLILKDTQSAEQFIRRLAQTFQYILSTQDRKYVLLKDEVEFVQSYYYLLRIRFQQQLNVEINLPSNIMNSRIPPLTLQMLVENAVKHNPMTSDKKLFVYITAQDNLYLRVINTKTQVLKAADSFHVGLENIKRRYQFFTDRKIEVKDDDKFTVSLPVIHSRNEHVEHKFSA